MSEFKPKVWMTCPLCNKQSPFPDPDYREWVGLTNEETFEIFGTYIGDPDFNHDQLIRDALRIEAKLKEKNT